MGRYDPKYSDGQREAIASAILDRRMSARQAVKAAEEGLDGLDPFTMPESTARDIAGKRRPQPPSEPFDFDAALADMRNRIVALLAKDLTRFETAAGRGSLSTQEWSHLHKLTRCARAAVQFSRELDPPTWEPNPTAGAETAAAEETADRAQSLVDEMLARIGAEANGNGTDHNAADSCFCTWLSGKPPASSLDRL